FAGAVIDTGATRVRFADGQLFVDSLRLQLPGLLTSGSGALGWRRPDRGTLVFDFAADSLSVLDSLVTWFAGPSVVAASGEAKLNGSAQVRLSLVRALAHRRSGCVPGRRPIRATGRRNAPRYRRFARGAGAGWRVVP